MQWVCLWCCDTSVKSWGCGWGCSFLKKVTFSLENISVINLHTINILSGSINKPAILSSTRKGTAELPLSEELRQSGGDEVHRLSAGVYPSSPRLPFLMIFNQGANNCNIASTENLNFQKYQTSTFFTINYFVVCAHFSHIPNLMILHLAATCKVTMSNSR